MATARSFTAARMLEIENTTVVDGDVDVDGNLILRTREGGVINAGSVKGPKGDQGPPGATGGVGSKGDPGATWHWFSGATPPSSGSGETGDFGFYPSTGEVYYKDESPAYWTLVGSLKGPVGDTGPMGSQITAYPGPPTDPGLNDDYHINTTNGDLYFWSGSIWVVVGNLKGPKGNTGDIGPAGHDGNDGEPGVDGATWHWVSGTPSSGIGKSLDWAIDPSTGNVHQKSPSGSWGYAGNIKGPKGDQGIQGVAGQKGDPGAGSLGGGKLRRISTVQSIPNATWTTISMDNIVHIMGSTISTTSTSIRVLAAGWWMIGGSIGYLNNTTGQRWLRIESWTGTDPGVGNGETLVAVQINAGANSMAVVGSTIANLPVNTYIRLLAQQTSGGTLNTNLTLPTEIWLTRIY